MLTPAEHDARLAAVRAQLETTRRRFVAMVEDLAETGLASPSQNKKWNVGEVAWHIAWMAAATPAAIDEARRGRGFSPPAWLANRLNVFMTRRGARGVTPERLLTKYEDAHHKLLATLETVGPADWERGAKSFGVHRTVEDILTGVPAHFEEHAAEVLGAPSP